MLFDIRVRRDFFIRDQDGTQRAEPFATHRIDFQMDCATNVQASLLAGKLLGLDAPGTETEIESVTLMSREDLGENVAELESFLGKPVSHASQRAEALSV